jgi:hypothetical protein
MTFYFQVLLNTCHQKAGNNPDSCSILLAMITFSPDDYGDGKRQNP